MSDFKNANAMHQCARDLANAGSYLIAILILVGAFSFGGMAALSPKSSLIGWAAMEEQPPQKQLTHLDRAVATAREIREALAKPIPGPAPLPPITAKLAYGQLKPNGKGAVAERGPVLPKAAVDAMAMDLSSYRSSSAVRPEMHKVY